jgi:formate dehydrogenase subunit gamma
MSDSRRVVRYGFTERVVHAGTALSYVYLLLTGLAFWTPALYWIAIVLGGGFLSRVLHPWVGVVYALIVARMFVMWRRDMRATPDDREWRRAMQHYIRNEDDRVPAAGRFNFGQKQLFWVMVWGTAVLAASGFVLWFPTWIPWPFRAVREAAILLHASAALVTIGGFIVHLYMGLAVVPGGLTAIVRGEVSEAWARQHHALWRVPQGRQDPRRGSSSEPTASHQGPNAISAASKGSARRT